MMMFHRKLYWVDEGGFGVPPKIGRVDMDGSNPIVLRDHLTRPEAITIDLDEKQIYFSTQYPSKVRDKSILIYNSYFTKVPSV